MRQLLPSFQLRGDPSFPKNDDPTGLAVSVGRMVSPLGRLVVNLIDLSGENLALVLAFVEIARVECIDRSWADIEPVLSACWNDTRGGISPLTWADISPYIRTACERGDK